VTAATASVTSVDRGLLAELAGEATWRVHSVFDRVVNLEGRHGLLAVAARGVGNAPRTLVVDTTDFRGHGIGVGCVVDQRDGNLRLGALTVRTGNARVWQGRLPPPIGAIADPRQAIGSTLLAHGRPGGALVAETPPGRGGLAGAMGLAVGAAIDRLVSVASTGRATEIRAAIVRLAGLGIGLTPSGDDVLVGAFVTGRWLGGMAGQVADAGGGLDFSGLTTRLGAAALAAAHAGQGPQPLHELLDAIADGGRGRIARATVALTRLGHTSGTDMAVGVLTALRLHFEQGDLG
jgi:hypothetical protein